jgi:chitinase
VDTSSGLSITLADTSTGSQETQDQYCRFINCGETCPNGFTTIVRDDDKGQIVLDSTECLSPSDVQTLCCPTSTEVPRCQWRGFHNSGHCNGGCNSGEAELGTINAGCSSGYQSACCTITTSTTPWANCQWTSGCESDNTCPSGYSNYVAGSRNGWGGLSACNEGENYNYCCAGSVPDPFTNCDWHGGVAPQPPNSRLCSDACPSGSIRIAEEHVILLWGENQQPRNTDSDCVWGHEALCCSGPSASSVSPRGPDPSTPQTQDGQEFEALLQKFFAAPTCPSGWDDQYSSSFPLSARDLDKRLTSDQSDTLTLLLPILSALVTSQYPREDLCDIWDYELNSNGYGSSGANCSTLNQAICGPSWNGYFSWTPDTLLSNVLCNIASSANGVSNMESASSALCYIGNGSPTAKRASSQISARSLSEVSMNDRSDDGTQPTITTAIHGILSVRDFFGLF